MIWKTWSSLVYVEASFSCVNVSAHKVPAMKSCQKWFHETRYAPPLLISIGPSVRWNMNIAIVLRWISNYLLLPFRSTPSHDFQLTLGHTCLMQTFKISNFSWVLLYKAAIYVLPDCYLRVSEARHADKCKRALRPKKNSASYLQSNLEVST